MHYQATKTMKVQSEAEVDLIEHIDTYTPCIVWSGSCRIWYKQGTVNESYGHLARLHLGYIF